MEKTFYFVYHFAHVLDIFVAEQKRPWVLLLAAVHLRHQIQAAVKHKSDYLNSFSQDILFDNNNMVTGAK